MRVSTNSSEGEYAACRLKDWDGRDPTNPVWFMPSANLKYSYSTLGGCSIEACTADENRLQLVGFGSNDKAGKLREVFNCQPLAYEEMVAKERQSFLLELQKTGVGEEYNISGIAA